MKKDDGSGLSDSLLEFFGVFLAINIFAIAINFVFNIFEEQSDLAFVATRTIDSLPIILMTSLSATLALWMLSKFN